MRAAVQSPAVILQKHLRDARRAAEVALDLECGMRAEEISVCVAGQDLREKPMPAIAVEQSRQDAHSHAIQGPRA